MKFSFARNALIKEIAIAQELTGRNAASVLSNVSLTAENNELLIKATDSKMNFQARIPVETAENGIATVFCSQLMSILQSLPDGDIIFEVIKNDELDVALIKHSTKKIRYQIRCRDENVDFAQINSEEFFDIPATDFKEMVLHTVYAVSKDEKRYFLNGVFFEKDEDNLVMVATDSKRLALESRPLLSSVTKMPSMIVSPKILNIVAKYAPTEGNISIAASDRSITFKFSNYILSSSLIDGSFPNYRRVIPDSQPHQFIADYDEFSDAIKRIRVIGNEAGKIFLEISSGNLAISANGEQGEAKEEIACEYEGEEMLIAINPKFLDEAVKVMDCAKISFEFSESLRAVTFRTEPAQSYFNILMPMQI